MPKPAAHSCCDEPPLLQRAASCCEVRPAAPARLPQAPETARVESPVAVLAHATPTAPALFATSARPAASAPAQPPDLLAQLCVLRI
jgi:hypothetical protein